MTTSSTREVSDLDLKFILNALETFDAELEQLEAVEEWFSSESRDILESAKQLMYTILEIGAQDDDEEYESDIYKETAELHFD